MSAPDSEILIGDQTTSADAAAGEPNADLLAELQRLKECVAALEEKARQSTVTEVSTKEDPKSSHERRDAEPEPPEAPARKGPAERQAPQPKAEPSAADQPVAAPSQSTPSNNGSKLTEPKPPDAKPAERQTDVKEPVVAAVPPRPTRQLDSAPTSTNYKPQDAKSKVPARPCRPVTTDDHKTNGKAAVEEDRKTKPARPESERRKVPRPVPLGAGGPEREPARQNESNEPRPQSASQQDEEPRDEAASPKRHWMAALLFRENIPGWSASMIVHAVAIVALALWTLAAPEDEPEIPIVANAVEVVEDMEEIEEELDLQVEKPIVEEFVPDVSDVIEDPGEAMLGDLSNTETAIPSDLGDLAAIDIGALGLDIDLMGDGKGKKGDGIGVASFFGVTTRGRKFMYVVDNSNSMNNGKFEMACNELFKSISGLSYDHEFYIIFYSDTAYPLFYPRSAPRWVKATPENVEKVRYWLDEVHRCLQTRGEEAMTKAFRMRPDVIYLLGDGSFTDKAVPTTLGFNDPNVVVHTMGFRMKDNARKGFEDISAKFRGKFHEVEVIPAAVQASKEKNRPKNNQQNGVWGINLGKGKKKK